MADMAHIRMNSVYIFTYHSKSLGIQCYKWLLLYIYSYVHDMGFYGDRSEYGNVGDTVDDWL